ncbi:MAG: diguanylate cyclase [Gammaproteobacteria bacterium]|nr:diguanylate cyclase [Gammaproteobacteria bacterium]
MSFITPKQSCLKNRIELLYKNSTGAFIYSSLIAAFVVLVTWQYFKMPELLIWLAALIIIYAVRFYLTSLYFKQNQQNVDEIKWQYIFYVGVIASGSIWGSIIWLKPESSTLSMHYFILMVLTGMAGGALTSYAASARAYALFALPLLLPFAVHELTESRELSHSIGLLIMVFLILTMLIARNGQKSVEKYIGLCETNTELCMQIQRANNMMEDVFCSTHVLFVTLDLDYNYLRVNKAFTQSDGRGFNRDYFVGKNHFELYPDEPLKKIFDRVCETGKNYSAESREFAFLHGSNEKRYWDWSLQAVKNNDNVVDSLLMTLVDVSAHKRAEFAIQEKEIFLNSVMETALDCIVATDDRGKIISLNSRVVQEFGYQREELLGKSVECLMPGAFREQHAEMLKAHTPDKNGTLKGRRLVSTGQKKNGESFPIEVAVSDTVIQGVRYYVAVLRDVSDTQALLRAIESSHQEILKTNKQLEERNAVLKELSSKDTLTALYNRRFFNEYLGNEWSRAVREKSNLSIMMFDIDYFKQYNDEYGHQQGDDCLKQVASCLAQVLHRPADLIARYGGEEFIAILPSTDSKGACVIAENMRSELELLKIKHKKSIVSDHVTVSIGVAAVIPETQGLHEKLISCADSALYEAKKQGRNRVVCITTL